jgi:hypothetical protein
MICTTTTTEGLINKKIIELPVYRLLSDLAKPDNEEAGATLKNLAEDDKFMKLVEDMHEIFDKGYNKLMKFRKP